MSEYQPEPGTWRLISPSGVEHIGDSPLHAVQAESRSRIPADVALNRIYAAIAPTLEDKAELDAHMKLVCNHAVEMANCDIGLTSNYEEVNKTFAAVRASALALMGLSE